MRTSRSLSLALLAFLALAFVPAPNGSAATACGAGRSSDPNLRLLDHVQSAGAAKICAIYLNTTDMRLFR
jgi:hypothetical protein